jgi:hypothetical protein
MVTILYISNFPYFFYYFQIYNRFLKKGQKINVRNPKIKNRFGIEKFQLFKRDIKIYK